jgi:RNA polymerase sigma factor (sigma-70 family)
MQPTDTIRAVSTSPDRLPRRWPSSDRRVVSPREIERLVEEARNLVPMFARRYLGRGVPFEDLVGAGNVGVVEAAYRFDPRRGVRFGSYAAWWIRKAIASALGTTASVVAVPRFAYERRRRVIDAITRGRPRGQRDLGVDDVAAGLGLTTQQAEQALAFSMGTVSLDAPLDGESGRSLGERLARPVEEGPEAVALSADRTRAARTALSALSSRQRRIIALRYGMGAPGAEPLSLAEIAQVVGLSRERVRQIEGEALDAIRRRLADVETRSGRG